MQKKNLTQYSIHFWFKKSIYYVEVFSAYSHFINYLFHIMYVREYYLLYKTKYN